MKKKFWEVLKAILGILVTIIIIGWFISNCVSNCSSRKEEEKAKAEEKLLIKKSIKDMIEKWNSIANWEKKLNRDLLFEYVLTAELQDLFIREDQRPILFFLNLRDVEKKDTNSFIAYFYKSKPVFNPIINFEINCNSEHYKYLVSEAPNRYFPSKFALIINVQDVYSSENNMNENLGEPGFIPTVKGNCLEIIRVDPYDKDELDF